MKNCMAGKGSNRQEAIMECKDTLIRSVQDPKKVDAIQYIAKIYTCEKNSKRGDCITSASKGLKYPENKRLADKIANVFGGDSSLRPLDISITHVPFEGKGLLTTYRLDSKNSNACAINKTEPSPTNTPCGVGGSVDQAIWKIKKGLKSSVKKELDREEVSPETLNTLMRLVEECGFGVDKCLADKHISAQEKKSLMAVFQKAKSIAFDEYASDLEKVNNSRDISLEGSKEEKPVEVRGHTLKVNTSLEANALYLLVLEGR